MLRPPGHRRSPFPEPCNSAIIHKWSTFVRGESLAGAVAVRRQVDILALQGLTPRDREVFEVTESVVALTVTIQVGRDRKHGNFGC